MHTWETMMSTPNFDQNWQSLSIKSEPESDSYEQKTMATFDQHSLTGGLNYMHPLGFNPLTPPGYPGNILLPQNIQRSTTPLTARDHFSVTQSLTPTTTPPMDVTPPKSPTDTPEKNTNTSDCDESYDGSDEEGDIRVPKMNSHGKVKTYKCKQCGYVAVTKVAFWDHTKSHLKPEKMLECKKCPFVTEYKHHLEYHLRNHDRSKPFQCPKCSYSCVNKSMLNSHLKSHSSVLQFRCADCNYATKYCHSLKLHLRKYTHKPDVVLNLDGTPNPLPIIDVYGTRRGPKQKSRADQTELKDTTTTTVKTTTSTTPPIKQQMTQNITNLFQNNSPGMPLLPYFNLNLHMFAAQRMAQMEDEQKRDQLQQQQLQHEETALNLVQKDNNNKQCEQPRTPKHRRKGRAFKLDRSMDIDEDTSVAATTMTPNTSIDDNLILNVSSSSNNHNELSITNSSNTNTKDKPVQSSSNNRNNNTSSNKHHSPNSSQIVAESNNAKKFISFECKFCDISFKDDVLYTIHMGYHGYNDVFKCNMCGEKCDDRVSFFLHIARSSHT